MKIPSSYLLRHCEECLSHVLRNKKYPKKTSKSNDFNIFSASLRGAQRRGNPFFLLLTLIGCFVCQISFASDLMDVYRDAAANDPSLKSAHNIYFSTGEQIPQTRAALLPNVSLTNATSRFSNQGDTNQTISAGDQSYDQNIFTLSATQPVFNYQSWMQFNQAKDTVKSAEASYNSAVQNLMVRVANAYFSVLQAKDNLRFTQAQKESLLRQMKQAEQRYEVGLDTKTAVYQAQASYDSMVAQEIADKNTLYIAFEQLRTLTNHNYEALAPLKEKNPPLVHPQPADSQVWVDKALSQNYALLSAKYTKDAARINIKAQQAGHYPTVDLGGSYSDTNNDATANPAPTGQNSAVTLTLTLPLYQGGLISSQTRQAEYDYEKSAADFQSIYLNTLVNTRTAYNTLIVTMRQIQADTQALLSSENSVQSVEAQYQAGTLTMVDVLQAQQQLYQAQTEKALDQYTYINSIVNLKYNAGTLSASDLDAINHWLDNNPQHAVHKSNEIE